jgi:TPR repeat protein
MFLEKINPDTGDFEKMIVHLEKNLLVENADTGKDWAQFELGKKYLGDDNIPEGLKYIQMSAEKGYAPAQYELGLLYQGLIGVPDLEKSFHFFFKAANQGFAKAQFKVARAYLKGLGVDKDLEQYFIWMKKSADLGYDRAQFVLGNSYLFDKDVLLGNKNLDYSHLLGEDGTEEQDKGFEYVLLAANQGNMDAIWLAACLYSNKDNKCLAIYYCKKYIKQSVTEKFNKDHKEIVIEILSQLSSVCGGCHKKGDGFKYCSKCNCIYYCSVECQIKDWKENGHKEQCKKLKELC